MITRVTTLTVYDTIHGTRQGSLFFYPYGISKGQSPLSVISNKQSDLLKGWWKVKWPPTVQKGHGLIWFTWKMLMSFFLVKKTWFYWGFSINNSSLGDLLWQSWTCRLYTRKGWFFDGKFFGKFIQKLSHGSYGLQQFLKVVPTCRFLWVFFYADFMTIHSFIYLKNKLIKHVCRPKKDN